MPLKISENEVFKQYKLILIADTKNKLESKMHWNYYKIGFVHFGLEKVNQYNLTAEIIHKNRSEIREILKKENQFL